MGKVLIYNLIKTPPLFFTERKLRPPDIGIETTAEGGGRETLFVSSDSCSTIAAIHTLQTHIQTDRVTDIIVP